MARSKILFLCTANSCRSQMAEGWCRALKGQVFECFSAGVEPSTLNPRAVQVMAEAGIDISSQYAKQVDSLKHIHFDLVVTVCDHAKESCPLFSNATAVLHRSFPDPAQYEAHESNEGYVLDMFRLTRDQIRDFILALPDELATSPHTK